MPVRRRASKTCGRDRGGGWTVALAGGEEHTARAVVLGVGGVPAVPECAQALLGPRVLHSGDYAWHREDALDAARVTVIGSGQSAAEVVADLLEHAPATRVDWFTRGAGFLAMEYSKLGLEHFSPEYATHFHGLSAARRDALRAGQDLLYKGISAETSARIFDTLYRRSIDGAEPDVGYAARCELRRGRRDARRVRCGSVLHHLDEDVAFEHETDVARARDRLPTRRRRRCARSRELAALDERGRPVIERGLPRAAARRRRRRRCSSRTPSCTRTASVRPTSASARTATRSSSTRCAGARCTPSASATCSRRSGLRPRLRASA